MIINLSKILETDQVPMTYGELVRMHLTGELYCDQRYTQRLLNKWDNARMSDFLEVSLMGCNFNTNFLVVDVLSVIEYQKEVLSRNPKNYKNEEEKLNHFVRIADRGVKYLLIDGQHRVDTLVTFMSGELFFTPRKPITTRLDDEEGIIRIEGRFTDLPDSVQKYFRDIPVICVKYKTGSIEAIIRGLVAANSGNQMTRHEKRIINYNGNNNFINDLCERELNISHMLGHVKAPNQYKTIHKGDTYLACEALLWINNNRCEFGEKLLDEAFGIEPKPELNATTTQRKLTANILSTVAESCAEYSNAGHSMSNFSIASIHNLFYTTAFLMQDNNEFSSNSKRLAGTYKIVDKLRYAEWFFDEENKRLNAEGTKIGTGIFDKGGREKMQVHQYSFTAHNADTKHFRKQSKAGIGGSKYTFDNFARIRYLLADLDASMTHLINAGIIQKVGDRSAQRTKILAELGVPLSKAKGMHVDEIVPVSKGGVRTKDNVRVLTARQNTSKGKKTGFKKVKHG
jgi:hypothetical protein